MLAAVAPRPRHWNHLHWWTVDRVSAVGSLVGGVATALAFAATAVVLIMQLSEFRTARQDRERRAAEAVTGWMTQRELQPDGSVTQRMLVKNAGTSPVYHCTIFVGPPPDITEQSEDTFGSFGHRVETAEVIPPGETYTSAGVIKDGFSSSLVQLEFMDAAQQWWRRGPNGTLTRRPITGWRVERTYTGLAGAPETPAGDGAGNI